MPAWLDRVRWNADGLVPAIAQDEVTQRVLTLAWMNREALTKTVKTREVRLDCDSDALLIIVEQVGGIACHTGRERCFYKLLEDGEWRAVEPVLKDPDTIYGE